MLLRGGTHGLLLDHRRLAEAGEATSPARYNDGVRAEIHPSRPEDRPMNEGSKEIVAKPDAGTGAERASPSSSHHVPSGDRTAPARKILNDALRRYRQPDGYEEDLVEAAWQLEQIGKDAWLALSELAFS